MTPEEQNLYKTATTLGLAGLIAGIGSLLASKETLTLRLIVGRALSSVMLGLGASAILIWYPEISLETKIGVACLFASVGTSGLEKIIQKIGSKDE